MKLVGRFAVFVAATTLLASASANAATFGTYGDATVTGSGFDLVSDTAPPNLGYAGVYVDYGTGGPTLANITQLSADYVMLGGSFGGGAPRFSIGDTTNNIANEIYVDWGTPLGGGAFSNPNPNGTPSTPKTNTGNYADITSADLRFQINGFGGDNSNPNAYYTWAQVLTLVGSVQVGFVSVDLDGGFTGTQHLLVDNFTVNGDVDSASPAPTPLPAALPLFASGLGVMGLLGWRRKRKAALSA